MVAPGFGRFLLDALGVREGELVAVVADHDRAEALALVRAATEERGATLHAVVTDSDYRSVAAMPEEALAATTLGDAVLLLVSTDRAQFGGHAAFRRAASARGARLGFVVEDRMPEDVALLARSCDRTREIAERLGEARTAEVRTAAGTRIRMDVTGRPGIPITPELGLPAAWGALPDYMEAAVAPVEGSAEGTIVVDGTCTHTGIQARPMRIEVADGYVTHLTGGSAVDLQRYLDETGDHAARNLAELGIGTNEAARSIQRVGTFLDKRMAGTAHFGIGDNISLAGTTTAPLHTDVQVLEVDIDLDGVPLLRSGELVV
jgi:leucyl aminopeptidase (aminopeptidase T)